MDRKTNSEKRPWSKPELVVLVRGNPEEAVLLACKTNTHPIGGGNQACKRTGKPCVASEVVTS